MTSLLRSTLALAAAASLSAGLFFAGAAAGNGNGNGNGQGHGPGTSQGGNGKGGDGKGHAKHDAETIDTVYQDGIKDYGVCRGTDPICYHDWGNGWEEGEAKRIFVWSRTAGPRHAHLGTPLAPGLNPPLNADNVAQSAIIAWAAERGIQVDYTEDLARFSNLNNYQAVVFLGSNRDTLDDTAQTNLLQYVRRGGGFVGIHNAFGAEYHWEWYEGLLGGANFYDHAPNRPGTIETIDDDDVSTEFLPETWPFTDEWYNLEPYPSYVNVLLEVDEATSLNGRANGHPGHGEEHAVSWCHYYDGGRAFLTTLGHEVGLYSDAVTSTNEQYFEEHVMAGIESAMGITPFCTV